MQHSRFGTLVESACAHLLRRVSNLERASHLKFFALNSAFWSLIKDESAKFIENPLNSVAYLRNFTVTYMYIDSLPNDQVTKIISKMFVPLYTKNKCHFDR